MMTKYILFCFCLATGALAQHKVNYGVDANYFVGAFNAGEFPSAIGFCNPRTVVGGYGNIAVCLDDEVVRYDQYASSSCFGEPNALPQYFVSISMNVSELLLIIEADIADNYATLEGEIFQDITIDDVIIQVTQTGTGSLYDFKCDGTDDYVAVSLQVAPCDTDRFFTYYAAINTCVQNCGEGGTDTDLEPSEYTSLSVYCDANVAELQYFENPDTCDFSNCTQANFYQVRNVTRDCGYLLTSGNADIYGKMTYCSPDVFTNANTTSAPTSMPTESPVPFVCQEVFGYECLECDGNGCVECEAGYRRIAAGSSGTFVCLENEDGCDDGIDACIYENCGDVFENPDCATFTSWGCTQCQTGYFKKSHRYPCVSCDTIPGCVTCSDFAGCLTCEEGMVRYWDPICQINKCSNTCSCPQYPEDEA